MSTETESTSAEKEAQEYWGYLFKADKTGTDKLKNLLRGLHRLIVGYMSLTSGYSVIDCPL